jgi:pimeloyl-ACP methyl ester carboxylesterase
MEDVELAGFQGVVVAGGHHTHPLVFLHGAWESHRCYEGYVRFFAARGWDCYAFSRRAERDRVRIEDYLDDTLRVLDQVGPAPLVIGHSLGGLLAQLVAERGRCAAAVLIEPGPPKGIPVVPKARTWPVFLRLAPRIAMGRSFLPTRRAARRAWLNRMPADQAAALHARLVPESGVAFRQVLLGYPVDAKLVRGPILCVSGLDSPSITPKMVAKTARRYGAELLELAGHSHWLMEEPGWEDGAAAIERWLCDVERGLSQNGAALAGGAGAET